MCAMQIPHPLPWHWGVIYRVSARVSCGSQLGATGLDPSMALLIKEAM